MVEPSIVPLAELLPSEECTVRAYGIVLERLLPRSRGVAGRRLSSWRVFPGLYLFEGVTVAELSQFRDSILFLVESAFTRGVEVEFPRRLVLYGVEFSGNPARLKRRFPLKTPVSGRVRLRHRVYDVDFVLRFPTNSRRHLLFLAGPGGAGLLRELTYRRHPRILRVLSVIDVPVQPLFRYSTLPLRWA